MENYLSPTYYFDYQHQAIQTFILTATKEASGLKDKVLLLYKAIRDGWFYDAYQLHMEKGHFKASHVVQRERGHCIDKAVLLISCLRSIGVPAKLHLVKVRNHIAAEQIVKKFGTDELTPHAFVEMYLNDKWVSATPAFNKSLCNKLNVAVMDFDGETDSLFQEYDKVGGKFMEYLADYGEFEDLPFDFIRQNMIEHYPGIARHFRAGKKWRISE